MGTIFRQIDIFIEKCLFTKLNTDQIRWMRNRMGDKTVEREEADLEEQNT